jgi:hypothetical protein
VSPQRRVLACGCPAILEHRRGERRVTCGGGGLPGDWSPNGHAIPTDEDRCPGGRTYKAVAIVVERIDYTVTPINEGAHA